MKNSASEVFCVNLGAAYIHAFGYIRQLAVHLRNSMKKKSKVSAALLLWGGGLTDALLIGRT